LIEFPEVGQVKIREAERKRQFRAVSFWLAEEDIEELRGIAEEKGVGHTTLVRMWVKEKLRAHRQDRFR
jgi:hypothetical protein